MGQATEYAASFRLASDAEFHSAVRALSRDRITPEIRGDGITIRARTLAENGFGVPDISQVIDSSTLDGSVPDTPGPVTSTSCL